MAESTDKEVCPLCNGQEWTTTEKLKTKPCICISARMTRQFLGEEIAVAENIRSSLFQPDADPPVDRSKENLSIKATWLELRSHLRWVLGCRYNMDPTFTFKVVSDLEILDVSLGNEAFKARTYEQRRRGKETYNTVKDFIGEESLVIVRLGWLGYRNRAAAGYLKEALGIRERLRLPTWLSETPDRFFGPGDHMWDDDVDNYITTHFDSVDLRTEEEVVNPPVQVSASAPTGHADDESVGFGDGVVPEHAATTVESSIPGVEEDRQDFRQSQRKRSGGWKPGRSGGDSSGPAGIF